MRSSTTFLAAAATLLSFAAATPLEARYETCIAPQQWHICGDGWSGCCSVSPCKGPSIASNCPDQGSSGPRPTPTEDESPPSESPDAPAKPVKDDLWQKTCKNDDSDCNWNATFYHIKNYDEKYASNSTSQLYVWKDRDDSTNLRRDAITVFSDIPDGVENCTLNWYKPATGIFYGTYNDGSFNLSLIDLGKKKLLDTVDGEINWNSAAELIKPKDDEDISMLDLGNWGRSPGSATPLSDGTVFSCKGKRELVFHFALSAVSDGAVIVDQVRKPAQDGAALERAGWFLKYKKDE